MTLIKRKEWGALPLNAYKYRVDPRRRTGIVIHHSVTETGHSKDDVIEILRRIDKQHQDKGWGGIGYNLAVDYAGRIYEGRAMNWLGAHTAGHNTANYGIVFIGDGRKTIPKSTLKGIQELIRLCERNSNKQLIVRGHRDYGQTLCPGGKLYQYIGTQLR